MMIHRNQLAIGLLCWVLAGCVATAGRVHQLPILGDRGAPYRYSKLITGVEWRLPPRSGFTMAYGSDLWPLTWSADGDLYAAWGDGGGFDGAGSREDVETNTGRVSLGIARISGTPTLADMSAVSGRNVWGALECTPGGQQPCAENQATFGGKMTSLLSVGGVLYGIGGFWTSDNCDPGCDPLRMGGSGPLRALAWSADGSRTWQIAPWAGKQPFTGWFLNFGRDNSGALDSFVYVYYTRTDPDTNIYLKRVARDELTADPTESEIYTYLTGVAADGNPIGWSTRESDAAPVFTDPNFVAGPKVVYDEPIGRFLLTVGHNPKAAVDGNSWSAGQVGLFEAPYPWGPWATVGYYSNWGHLGDTTGDYLDLNIPSKWIGPDGTTLWAVFSGVGPSRKARRTHLLDSFNLAMATLTVSPAIPTIGAPAAGTSLMPGSEVAVEGAGSALQWSATLFGARVPAEFDQLLLASGSGTRFTFTVPADAPSTQMIRVRLTSGSGASVYRDYPVRAGSGPGSAVDQ